MAVVKNFRLKKNFYKKLCLPVITLNKKYLSKQVVPITYTLERTFFVVATFGRFASRFFPHGCHKSGKPGKMSVFDQNQGKPGKVKENV